MGFMISYEISPLIYGEKTVKEANLKGESLINRIQDALESNNFTSDSKRGFVESRIGNFKQYKTIISRDKNYPYLLRIKVSPEYATMNITTTTQLASLKIITEDMETIHEKIRDALKE